MTFMTEEELAQLEVERAALVEQHGEQAVAQHFVWLVNFHRVHALFPVQPDTEEEAAWRMGIRPAH